MGLAAIAKQVGEAASGASSARAAGLRALRVMGGLNQHLEQLSRRPASWFDILSGKILEALPSFAELDGVQRELERLCIAGHGEVRATLGDVSMKISEARDVLASTMAALANMRRLAQRDR